MSTFELSLSPVFNEIIRAAEVMAQDPQDTTSQQELAQAIAQMAEFSQTLAQTFQQALQVRPKTELSQRIPGQFAQELASLTQVLNNLKGYLKDPNPQILERELPRGRQVLGNMFAIFEEMKREEESFPIFSKSPYIQEIVRIATGVAKNQYKPEVLKERVEWLRDRYLEFKDDFRNLQEIPKENEEVEKLLPIAQQALEQMGQALKEMERFQRGFDKSLLKNGCSRLLQASEVLLAVQERLMKASTAQPAACPHCGTLNPGGAKKCRHCGSKMPQVVGLSTKTMELKENFEPNAQAPSYTYLVRLEGSINSFRRGLLERSDLKREIDFFAGKVAEGRAKFTQLQSQSDRQPEAQTEKGQRAYQMMAQGLNSLESGVAQMRQYFTTEAESDLEKGLELVNAGAEEMIAAQESLLR